jgi:trk system potassium uptake protein TrkA
LGDKNLHEDAIVVIGLGRFGAAIADALNRLGHDVLAIERDPRIVQDWAGKLTHVVEADGTNIDALKQLGVQEFKIAVVGIGTSIESSVLATANLVDMGNKQVWAKAITPAHGRILQRIGAHRVVYPEADAGEKVAHLVSGKLLDYIEFDDGFAIVKTKAPTEAVGKTLGESRLRSKYGVTVVGVKQPGEDFTYATPDTVIAEGDTLIVSGATTKVEAFASTT